MNKTVRFAAAATCVLAIVACNRSRKTEEERAGTTRTTGAAFGISNDSAINRVVAARCAREAKCNNIGADKRYETPSVCSEKLRADMRNDLTPHDCPRGVDNKELNDCLDAIQKEDCNNPIDTIGRLNQCRTSELCLKNP